MLFIVLISSNVSANTPTDQSGRIISIYDRGEEKVIVTKAGTVAEALEKANVTLAKGDTVEPAPDTKLVANNYQVNVYRSRPVVILDGQKQVRVMTSHQSSRQIAEVANITLHEEDETQLDRVNDLLEYGGAGLKMTIDRATPFHLVLYGKKMEARTQAATVGDMLKKKEVKLGPEDVVSVPLDTPITQGATVEVWRNGVQTINEEQPIDYEVEEIQDADRNIGFREVKTPGKKGIRTVTYEVEMHNGKELSRKEIQNVVAVPPKKEIVIVGTKPSGDGLSKSKGVLHYTDSRGVVHRETYYDLPMNVVIGFCGGGSYSVRADGAKVDEDGYILVAANLSRYPRCSTVETSLGPGKVYDTGGFATVHPDGFDLATDWTNNDGR